MNASPIKASHRDYRFSKKNWCCEAPLIQPPPPSIRTTRLTRPQPNLDDPFMNPTSISAVVTTLLLSTVATAEDPPRWSADTSHRLLVKVPPVAIEGRDRDEHPAEFQFLPGEHLPEGRRIDVASLQVVRYDQLTGESVMDGNYAYGRTAADRPYRWYDAAVPYHFPEMIEDVSRTGGEIVREERIRAGYFFNAVGDWKAGRLVWMHTQQGNSPSFYAVYFDLLPEGDVPGQIPPRGWIGDGLMRCDERGATSTGADHCRIDLDDWDGDGLIDIIGGEQDGHVFVWPNRGTPHEPLFPLNHFVFVADGLPIDAGSAAAPKVVDWNADGAKDLLVGAEWNRILLFLNRGTDLDRRLEYVGLLQSDGETLTLPIEPLARGSEQVFKRDYYPVLDTADWDNDGDLDLLAGGYVTGRIYIYENTGSGSDGLPVLSLKGPLEADGEPLNVGHWCASPCTADFDADGDLDLMSGHFPTNHLLGPAPEREFEFLQFYENIAGDDRPEYAKRPFPVRGDFPHGALATPRAADWDADGDLDLIVSARENLFLIENRGTAQQPEFIGDSRMLIPRWGSAPIPADQFLDWNQDGLPDIFSRGRYSVRLNSGKGNPWSWDEEVPILPPGEWIAHPSGIGDDWFWPFLDDFDDDGRTDILFGDWHGHIWFHRNLTTGETPSFDLEGDRLQLVDGETIKVGPVGKDTGADFVALQGARTTFTVADFDRDGRRDLVVGDTYGKVRFFRRAGDQDRMAFEQPVELGDLGIRLLVDAADWNGDGRDDVIAGAVNGRVRVFINAGTDPVRFEKGIDPNLPPIQQPRVLMVDLNGDGDEDLFLPSTQGACFIERSFLQRGYATAEVIAVEQAHTTPKQTNNP